MKLAFVSSHPAPYRDSFLGGLVRNEKFSTDVFSLFPKDSGHDYWQLEASPYENKVIVTQDGTAGWRVFLRLLKTIVFGGYDCVCWPGFSPFYLALCMLIQALCGKKYSIAADTVSQRKIWGGAFQFKKFLVRHASLIFVPGVRSRDFFVGTFNVETSKVCLGAYSLDGILLEEKIGRFREERDNLRLQYGIGCNEKVFLMVANMIKTRYYPVTAEAFLHATHARNDVRFVMVGRGPELSMMQELAEKEPSLKVLPGVSFEEMLKLYALADVYVHGGTEPASTALIIGAIANLPLISSPAVGCYDDVVRDGETGYSVADYLSVPNWEQAFARALEGKGDWIKMGKRARALSRKLDSDLIVAEFCEKMSMVLKGVDDA